MTAGILHLMTVGQSLLERVPRALPALHEVLNPQVLSEPVAEHLTRYPADGIDSTDLLPTPEARDALADAPPELCAEWTSLAAHRQRPGTRPAAETVVLLASDTSDGIRAAVLVGLHLGQRIRYVHDLDPTTSLTSRHGEVLIVRVPGLNFAREAPDRAGQAWTALGLVGLAVARAAHSDDHHVVLHLSGGFKAAIPYLMVMADGIQTQLAAADGHATGTAYVSAVCVHESSLRHGAPYLVDLPVRRLGRTLHGKLLAPGKLDNDLYGLFADPPAPGRPAQLNWAGLIVTGILRNWS